MVMDNQPEGYRRRSKAGYLKSLFNFRKKDLFIFLLHVKEKVHLDAGSQIPDLG